jgi:hypothetical protein
MRRTIFLILISTMAMSCASKPQDFACDDALMSGNILEWAGAPYSRLIQRDAGFDDLSSAMAAKNDFPDSLFESLSGELNEDRKLIEDVYFEERLARVLVQKSVVEKQSSQPRSKTFLLLSGGGQWGAFGAGFIREWREGSGSTEALDFVTGISTGAIQGLFVSAGNYERLEAEYRIPEQTHIAKYLGTRGLLFHGGQYDTRALTAKLKRVLCDEECALLNGIARKEAPRFFVGIVRLSDGRLLIVDIQGVIKSYWEVAAGGKSGDGAELSEQTTNVNFTKANAAEVTSCVTGIVMASAQVPIQLAPVRINGRAFGDGGIRTSVFAESAIESIRTVNRFYERRSKQHGIDTAQVEPPPTLIIIRNGPTVTFSDRLADESDAGVGLSAFNERPLTLVDVEPNFDKVALRAFGIIVNQIEVDSIAKMRLGNATGDIQLITADGFYAYSEKKCDRPRDADKAFDPEFMSCLIEYGKQKASACNGAPDWIRLPKSPDEMVQPACSERRRTPQSHD